MSKYIPTLITFSITGKDYEISWQDTSDLPDVLEYEIEDEFGKIILGTCQSKEKITLPRLTVGYYHLRLKREQILQDSLLLIAPQKAYYQEKIPEITHQPISSLQELKSVLQQKEDLHYEVPFPKFSDLLKAFNLPDIQINQKLLPSDLALFLSLKSQYKINRDFQDWSNCCYDFNKINSYKSKDFAKKNETLLLKAESVIEKLQDYLSQSMAFLHKQQKNVISYISMPMAEDYQSFLGWKNRKMLLNKQCKNNLQYVPYDSLIIKENFYNTFIEKVRHAMQQADALFIKNYETLEKNICTNFPFPDKEEKYDTDVLLAILKIESHRHQCMVMANKINVSDVFFAQSQKNGIIFEE